MLSKALLAKPPLTVMMMACIRIVTMRVNIL